MFGSQLTKITRKWARGRKRLGTRGRQLRPGPRLLGHAALAASPARLNMSQRRRPESCSRAVAGNFVAVQRRPRADFSSLQPLPLVAKPVSGCITSTGSALARAVTSLGRVWPPQTGDRFLPHKQASSLASEQKDAGNRLRCFREGASASFLQRPHPQITQSNARLLMDSQTAWPS